MRLLSHQVKFELWPGQVTKQERILTEIFFFTGKRMTRKMCKILKDSRQDADQ